MVQPLICSGDPQELPGNISGKQIDNDAEM
jgi:hypothetical protein